MDILERLNKKVKLNKILEGKISNDSDLTDYANSILKKAHGEKFDEEIVTKMLDELKKKYTKDGEPDYGAIVGAIQNSVSESVIKLYEELSQDVNGNLINNLDFDESMNDVLDLCAVIQNLHEFAIRWHELNETTLMSKTVLNELELINDFCSQILGVATLSTMVNPKLGIELFFKDEDLINKRLAPLIRRTDEWKMLGKLVNMDMSIFSNKNMNIRALIISLIDRSNVLLSICRDTKI